MGTLAIYPFFLIVLSFPVMAAMPATSGTLVGIAEQSSEASVDGDELIRLPLGDMSFLLPSTAGPWLNKGNVGDVGKILMWYSLPSGMPWRSAPKNSIVRDAKGYSLNYVLIDITRNEHAGDRFGLKYMIGGQKLKKVSFKKLDYLEKEGFEAFTNDGDITQSPYFVNESKTGEYPYQNAASCSTAVRENPTPHDICSIQVLLRQDLVIYARFNQYYLNKLPDIYGLLLRIYNFKEESDA